MKAFTLNDLLKVGAHFGHNKSRWNPKMKQYIFGTRGEVHIIDLEKTKQQLEEALNYLSNVAKTNGSIMIVGTKKQTREVVRSHSISMKSLFVSLRWLGGTFTNFRTIIKTIKKLERLESVMATPEQYNQYTKKERLGIEREVTKLQRLFEGLKDMKLIPDCIFVTDVNHDNIAVEEARILGVKVVGIVDTNSDPSKIDYPIPCNDDSTKALDFILDLVEDAVEIGKKSSAPEQKIAKPELQ